MRGDAFSAAIKCINTLHPDASPSVKLMLVCAPAFDHLGFAIGEFRRGPSGFRWTVAKSWSALGHGNGERGPPGPGGVTGLCFSLAVYPADVPEGRACRAQRVRELCLVRNHPWQRVLAQTFLVPNAFGTLEHRPKHEKTA